LKLVNAINASYVITHSNSDNTNSYYVIQKSSFEILLSELKSPVFQHLYKLARQKPMVLENQGKSLMLGERRALALLCIILVLSSLFRLEGVAVSDIVLKAKYFFPDRTM